MGGGYGVDRGGWRVDVWVGGWTGGIWGLFRGGFTCGGSFPQPINSQRAPLTKISNGQFVQNLFTLIYNRTLLNPLLLLLLGHGDDDDFEW